MLWGQKDQDEFAGTINQTIAYQHISAVLGMNEYVFTHISFCINRAKELLQARANQPIQFNCRRGCSNVEDLLGASEGSRYPVG